MKGVIGKSEFLKTGNLVTGKIIVWSRFHKIHKTAPSNFHKDKWIIFQKGHESLEPNCTANTKIPHWL